VRSLFCYCRTLLAARKIRWRRRFINLIVPIGEHEVPQPNEMNASRRSNELLVRKQKCALITNVQWTASDLSRWFPGGNAFYYRATPIVRCMPVCGGEIAILSYITQRPHSYKSAAVSIYGEKHIAPTGERRRRRVCSCKKLSRCCTLVFFWSDFNAILTPRHSAHYRDI